MEENLKRSLYKLELQLIKLIPIVIAVLSFIDTILSYLDIDGVCIAYINALLVWSFLYLSSFVFRFCRWHRMFLYYILVEGIINWYDYTYIIPLDLKTMIVIQLSLFLIFTCTAIYLKKHDKHPFREDYINSIIHEAEHIKQAMLYAYNVDDKGEPPAYTIGYIAMKLLNLNIMKNVIL